MSETLGHRNPISIAEIRSIGKDLRSRLRDREFSDLMSPKGWKSALSFGMDWVLILLFASLGVRLGSSFLPWVLIVIGSRQRALLNLVHDGSHGNLFKSKFVNDWVTNLFCAYPMFESVESYRKSHMAHHRHLGSPEFDPDSRTHLKYGLNDQNPYRGSALFLYLKLVFNRLAWRDSLGSGFFSMDRRFQKRILVFHFLWIGAFVFLFGKLFTAQFFGLWILSRATGYHAIRIFAEFMDHFGLDPRSVVSFTRTLPHNGLLPFVLHPHQDTYHLVHHLFPKVPHYKLSVAAKVLWENAAYRGGHHCDSYFFGKHSALSCWVGKCPGVIKRVGAST